MPINIGVENNYINYNVESDSFKDINFYYKAKAMLNN